MSGGMSPQELAFLRQMMAGGGMGAGGMGGMGGGDDDDEDYEESEEDSEYYDDDDDDYYGDAAADPESLLAALMAAQDSDYGDPYNRMMGVLNNHGGGRKDKDADLEGYIGVRAHYQKYGATVTPGGTADDKQLERYLREELRPAISGHAITADVMKKMAQNDKGSGRGGLDSRDPFIVCAAAQGLLYVVSDLLDMGVSPDRARRWEEVQDKYGGYSKEWTWSDHNATTTAILFGHVDVAKLLVSRGANPNQDVCYAIDENTTATQLSQKVKDPKKKKLLIDALATAKGSFKLPPRPKPSSAPSSPAAADKKKTTTNAALKSYHDALTECRKLASQGKDNLSECSKCSAFETREKPQGLFSHNQFIQGKYRRCNDCADEEPVNNALYRTTVFKCFICEMVRPLAQLPREQREAMAAIQVTAANQDLYCSACETYRDRVERALAAERSGSDDAEQTVGGGGGKKKQPTADDGYLCLGCDRSLERGAFSGVQMGKGAKKRRCAQCIAAAAGAKKR